MSDEEPDNFMYIVEAMAYISATFASIIYMWETCLKKRNKRKKPIDLELGIVREESSEEGDETSPLSESSPFRRRKHSNMSN